MYICFKFINYYIYCMNYSIVVLDDHEAVSKAITGIFKSHPYTIATSKSSLELLSLLHKQPYHLLILDYEIGNQNAIDIIPLIRSIQNDIPILIYTMHNAPWIISLLVKIGVKGIIDKNETLSELEHAVEGILSKNEHYYSPSMLKIILSIMGDETIKTELIYKPSPREKEIINLLSQGYTSSQISEKLYLSKNTVDTIRKNILLKSGALNVSHLMRMAFLHGWIET